MKSPSPGFLGSGTEFGSLQSQPQSLQAQQQQHFNGMQYFPSRSGSGVVGPNVINSSRGMLGESLTSVGFRDSQSSVGSSSLVGSHGPIGLLDGRLTSHSGPSQHSMGMQINHLTAIPPHIVVNNSNNQVTYQMQLQHQQQQQLQQQQHQQQQAHLSNSFAPNIKPPAFLSSNSSSIVQVPSGFVDSSTTSGARMTYEEMSDVNSLVDGALELSAVARPFVPKTFSPAFGSNESTATVFPPTHSHPGVFGSARYEQQLPLAGFGGVSWNPSSGSRPDPFDPRTSLQLPHMGPNTAFAGGRFLFDGTLFKLMYCIVTAAGASETRRDRPLSQQQATQNFSRSSFLGAEQDRGYSYELDEGSHQLPQDIDSFLLDVVDSTDLKYFDPSK